MRTQEETMETLRAFVIRVTYGLALAISGAATLLPSAAAAASEVYGLRLGLGRASHSKMPLAGATRPEAISSPGGNNGYIFPGRK
jgi:hypothetical protein